MVVAVTQARTTPTSNVRETDVRERKTRANFASLRRGRTPGDRRNRRRRHRSALSSSRLCPRRCTRLPRRPLRSFYASRIFGARPAGAPPGGGYADARDRQCAVVVGTTAYARRAKGVGGPANVHERKIKPLAHSHHGHCATTLSFINLRRTRRCQPDPNAPALFSCSSFRLFFVFFFG